MIVDGGPNYELDRYIDRHTLLNFCKLDLVVLTHADFDHVKGLNRLLGRCHVARVIFNISDKQSNEYLEFLDLSSKFSVSNAYKGDVISFDDLIFKVLWPPRNKVIRKENDKSIVLEVSDKDMSFLLMGDLEQKFQSQLELEEQSVEIFKLSHHGALNGLNKDLYEKVFPRKCIVSVGENNRYSHPSEEVIDYVKSRGCKVYRTDLDGTIEFFY